MIRGSYKIYPMIFFLISHKFKVSSHMKNCIELILREKVYDRTEMFKLVRKWEYT